ncbi:TetR/AcrR family transcriptional regulator [Rossellomorea sp. BNER]|uniref:TetR/AcrR family transcriptional regulator n=1 Tax=Rossellomorea sp. BNER TaxID=2962031 RepID=UPI003AF21389|nr:TetR/AcrR family transcriptional regulator [Rossellomorea sp. BNER]
MDGYQLRTEKKKEKIRNVAIELFLNFGIEKVSIAEIAKKASVSPVTIYNHFGTKDELVRKVITSFLQKEWENRLEITNREELSFHEKIEMMVFETESISGKTNPEFLNSLINGDPELQKMIEEMYHQYLPSIVEFFEEGKKQGYMDPDISNETIMIYLNLLKNAMSGFQFYDDHEKNSKLAKDLSKFFFYGLLNKAPDRK